MQETTSKKLSLLYVGSNPEVLDILNKHPNQINLVHQDNGLKAIDYLRRFDKIDAILSEAHLPGIPGDEMAVHIKERLGMWKIPVVIIQYEKDKEYRARLFKKKLFVNDLYSYPFDFNVLLTRIQFLIHYLNDLRETPESLAAKEKMYKIPLVKRLFDIVVSGTALLLLSPVLLIVALAIKLESKGPVIYKSKRVGTGYRIFDFLKFRSMYTGADAKLKELEHLNQYNNTEDKKGNITLDEKCPRCAKLPEGEYCSPKLFIGGQIICEYWYHELSKRKKTSTFIKIENDPRITKVGKFIRNTSIDELPQLINVLKGDMSIVGNRPLPLYEAEQLTSDDWSARFMAPAGITGLWQVELRGKGGDMSEEERKALDNQYAMNHSVLGDIKLILRTIPALFQKENV